MTKYNRTQLNPDITFERHVYHRDQFAHYLRWTHVLKRAKIGMNILDFGCGSGNLVEVFYRNRLKPANYLGLDIRQQTINNLKDEYAALPWVFFECVDLCATSFPKYKVVPDIICCFEVAEHIGKHNINQFLKNIAKNMGAETTLLLSTPCYDEKVGAADNHIIDGEVGEFTYDEMKEKLLTYFTIKNKWGTFASKKDYKKLIPEELYKYYYKLNEYYDDNLISNLMAPLFPEHSRNVIWECTL